ncbi:hypothetical protein [Cellulosimicrobium marinum]|uniref:hypothetical protein n=1 Tax=Cellulosimicrobium marinum TaxID=1638992 RepID=UPI001E44377B|nr:hypothetical protein [Cellulosimicrobium marinum]MCB7134977.1 hypothetical protein [Cellulosimicrobium marinum]
MSWSPPPVPPPNGRRPATHPAAAMRRARLRRRGWWVLGTLPLVLALVLFGFKLALLAPLASFARHDYDDGAYADAAGTYGAQRTLNLVDPWKAHFNTGTALAAEQNTWSLYDATTSLHRAYELAEGETPEVRCAVQTNLALAYELTGDDELAQADEEAAELRAVEDALAARDAGQPYDEDVLDPYGDGTEPDVDLLRQKTQDWYAYAERSFATAEQVRGWPDCGESDRTQEEQDQAEAAQQRVEDKQQQARDGQDDAAGEPPPGGGSAGSEGGDGSEDGEGSDAGEQGEASDAEGDGQDGAEGDGSGGEGQRQAEREEQERQERLEEQNSRARDEADRQQQEYRDLYGDEPGGGSGSGGDSPRNW